MSITTNNPIQRNNHLADKSSTPPTKPGRGKKVLHTFLTILAVLVVAVVLAGYILFGFSPVPAASTYQLDLAQIRQLAGADGSLLPIRLNALVLGQGSMPQFVVFAGGGLQSMRMPVPVFQVVYPNGTVIVDTGMDKAGFDQMFPGGSFSTEKYDQLQTAMRQSQTILLTHEHLDHIAGLANSPYRAELLPKVLLTRQQIGGLTPDTGLTPELLARFTPLDYDQYYLVAPGLVLVKAAGHSPGSQMAYLRLQNGNEFLLVGDVVWNMQSLTRLTGRPLFISLMLQEDRSATQNQLRTLYNVSQSEPVHLLISHDYEQIDSYIQQGLVGGSFE
jgi:glyoxylase-like metal-dependent hydrolase (beta-lactamase superfamily II)